MKMMWQWVEFIETATLRPPRTKLRILQSGVKMVIFIAFK